MHFRDPIEFRQREVSKTEWFDGPLYSTIWCLSVCFMLWPARIVSYLLLLWWGSLVLFYYVLVCRHHLLLCCSLCSPTLNTAHSPITKAVPWVSVSQLSGPLIGTIDRDHARTNAYSIASSSVWLLLYFVVYGSIRWQLIRWTREW